MVVLLGGDSAGLEVVGGHREHAGSRVEGDVTDRGPEPDLVAYAAPVDAAPDVVPQHLAGWVRGDGLAEVLLEAVVGELQALLGAVGP